MYWWLIDILVVLFLVVLNGIFSMAEIAIVSARKARLERWAEEGNTGARTALELSESPNMFLSTVQIGITLVGVLSGAFGGATIAGKLSDWLSTLPHMAPYSETLSLAIVVTFITYLSLVVGELAPKRIGLNSPERIASLAAAPMRLLSKMGSPVVKLLSASTELVLKLVGMKKATDQAVTEEELRAILEEAAEAGVIEEGEQDMVERVFRLGDRPVGVLMTPRRKIVWLDVNDSPKKIQHKILEHSFSYFPVCQGRLANIIGVARARDLLVRSLKGQPLNLKECAEHPLFVFEGMPVVRTMEIMKESSRNTAVVVDEYGGIEGLVTVDDIMKSVFGQIPSERDSREGRIIQRHEGSWLVDGMIPLDELKDFLDIKSLPGEKAGHFQTLGGFMMSSLKRIPTTGDHFECCGVSFEVVDMDGHRVDKVLIERSGQDGSKE